MNCGVEFAVVGKKKGKREERRWYKEDKLE
jgi:hypothetical protein